MANRALAHLLHAAGVFEVSAEEAVDLYFRQCSLRVTARDLAAMGATEALGLTVGLVAPSSTPWPWVEGVYQGIAAALQAHGGVLLGGDCSGGAQRLLAITALGRLPAGGGPIRRGDGRPGDLLLCTGPHGLSRLGLAVLLGDPAVPTGPEPDGAATTSSRRGPPMATVASPGGGLIQRAISAHQRPVPRFDAVRALIGCRPAGMAWRVGGCDSSDGLAAATAAIARASGCGARLDRTRLPLDPAMAALPQAQTWCLNGGEDFELVLALEPAWADALIAALPGAGLIGELMDAAPGSVGWTQGGGWPADAVSGSGFQHFR